jgi:hypothetical protein
MASSRPPPFLDLALRELALRALPPRALALRELARREPEPRDALAREPDVRDRDPALALRLPLRPVELERRPFFALRDLAMTASL